MTREEERTTSFGPRARRDDVARGADVVAGRQRRHEMAAAAEQLSCAHDSSVWAPFKRRLRLTSGPRHFFIY
jgi:hypothetical protein